MTLSSSGAFKLYDLDGDGTITRDEMLEIVKAIFSMVGNHAKFKDDDNTPEKRVDRIFEIMDTVSVAVIDNITAIWHDVFKVRNNLSSITLIILYNPHKTVPPTIRNWSILRGMSEPNMIFILV